MNEKVVCIFCQRVDKGVGVKKRNSPQSRKLEQFLYDEKIVKQLST